MTRRGRSLVELVQRGREFAIENTAERPARVAERHRHRLDPQVIDRQFRPGDRNHTARVARQVPSYTLPGAVLHDEKSAQSVGVNFHAETRCV